MTEGFWTYQDQESRTAFNMNLILPYIVKNGIWWTLPPLLFSLGLMAVAPTALTPTEFNVSIPNILLLGEMIGRLIVFAMPLFSLSGLLLRVRKLVSVYIYSEWQLIA